MNIPLFPLNLVLLPNEELSLHIFESRYKKMITNCLEKNNNFGVILKTHSKQYNIGCTAKIVDVLETYDTGEYDIVVKGDKRFNINNIDKKNPITKINSYYQKLITKLCKIFLLRKLNRN